MHGAKTGNVNVINKVTNIQPCCFIVIFVHFMEI